jgi:cell division protein FtsB
MPRTPFVVVVLLVVVGGVLGVLLLNTKINENAFLLHELKAEQLVLDQREQQLEQEVAEAGSTAQLAAAARRLGLVQAGELAYLRLPAGVVTGEPVPVPDQVGVADPPAGG